jgi:hypothetical protein
VTWKRVSHLLPCCRMNQEKFKLRVAKVTAIKGGARRGAVLYWGHECEAHGTWNRLSNLCARYGLLTASFVMLACS